MIFVLCTVPWRCASILEAECHSVSSSAVMRVEHCSSCSKYMISHLWKIDYSSILKPFLPKSVVSCHFMNDENDAQRTRISNPTDTTKSNLTPIIRGPEGNMLNRITFQLLVTVIVDWIRPQHFFKDVLYSRLNNPCLASLLRLCGIFV